MRALCVVRRIQASHTSVAYEYMNGFFFARRQVLPPRDPLEPERRARRVKLLSCFQARATWDFASRLHTVSSRS